MTVRVDWCRVLGDIAHLLGDVDQPSPTRMPCSQEQLAAALKIPRGTLRGWMDGSEPRHTDGEALLDRWCRMTGKARIFAPTERRSLSAHFR